MLLRLGGGLAISVVAAATAWNMSFVCEGFVEENDLRIPTHFGAFMVRTGIDESIYNDILDRIENIYGPKFNAKGVNLKVNRQWTNDTVNAYAQRSQGTWSVSFPGGLPRHPSITADGFALVACHEVGHHLAGYPANDFFGTPWMSIEGQSDYYANTKCLREYFTSESNLEFFKNNEVDPEVVGLCQDLFQNEQDWMSCSRGAMAGMSVANLFKELRKETKDARFDTPDANVVSSTFKNHPGTQCRLDTYLSGSLCIQDKKVEFGSSEEQTGACTPEQGFQAGTRPLCWFKPTGS